VVCVESEEWLGHLSALADGAAMNSGGSLCYPKNVVQKLIIDSKNDNRHEAHTVGQKVGGEGLPQR
jgi:hypothetical protein